MATIVTEQAALVMISATCHPRAQPRPRATKRGDRASVYDPGSADGFKRAVQVAAIEQGPKQPLDLPLIVEIIYYMPRPKSHFGTGKNSGVLKETAPISCGKKPDLDNLNKASFDALNDIDFWRDDALVVEMWAAKRYCGKGQRPGCEIRVYESEQP